MNGPRSYTLTQGPSHDALSPNILLAVRSLRRVGLFATPWTAARQASLSVTVSWSLLRLLSTESVMPSNRQHPPNVPLLQEPEDHVGGEVDCGHTERAGRAES